jgi:hypothetical protein
MSQPLFTMQDQILGLTGSVSNVRVAVQATLTAPPASTGDLDLKHMAAWAMHYLINTPRPEFDYEPVFQCHPLLCPPVPAGHDVVVPCDTDARMNWEWYYMRDVSGSQAGRDVEAAFHRRMMGYVQPDGTVLAHVGCYNEGDINKVYTDADRVYHVWGATKILHALAEDYRRTGSVAARDTARKIMLRLKQLAVFTGPDTCYFPAGMGAVSQDGTPVSNSWNPNPAPVVEPLLNYYLATGDAEALTFARAYAEGIMSAAQPGGIHIGADGSFGGGHGHAVLHALWGIAHLGIVTGDARYTEFVKRSLDWVLSLGTGTGWLPAAPDWAANCNEMCMISDAMSNAALIARAGYPDYFDDVERFLRNYISNLQFIVTPEFEAYYRRLHPAAAERDIEQGLLSLRKFQGGIIGGSGLNAYENELLHAHGFEMFGCCAPEGMRAIYTAWTHTIQRLPASPLGPEGVYVNLCLNRDSEWGNVHSAFPAAGGFSVKARIRDTFYLRPPHWAPRAMVHCFRNGALTPAVWSGAYVRFDDVQDGDELALSYPLLQFTHVAGGQWQKVAPALKLTFEWRGNMVVSVDPPAQHTPLFIGHPRQLPPLI